MRKAIQAAPLLGLIIIFTACSNYGVKIKINPQSEVYVKEGASKEDGRRLGDFLLRNNYFDTLSDKAVQVSKVKDTFLVKFVVKKEKLIGNKQAGVAFRVMQILLKDSVFGGKPTKVILADIDFKDIEAIKEISQQEIDGATGAKSGSVPPDSTKK